MTPELRAKIIETLAQEHGILASFHRKRIAAQPDDLLQAEYQEYLDRQRAKKQRGWLSSAVTIIVLIVLAANVPKKADHERELRPAVDEWARTVKTKNLDDAVAKFLLQLGTSAITSDPNTSIIDTCNWKYQNLFIGSIVIDNDDSHDQKLVSWGLFNHVFINSKKFTH